VEVTLQGGQLMVKGSKGVLNRQLADQVEVKKVDDQLTFAPRQAGVAANALAGTTRALVFNMVKGVAQGFEKRLQLVGVGYRAQAQGKTLNLTLGFSHPIAFAVPEGVVVETPSQTEIVVKGPDKQQVGQVAANIRAYRPPEPYQGKGVKYVDEVIIRKEAKKK
jgi:large subunit ribosomal protein L6